MTALRSSGALSAGRDASCTACQMLGNMSAGRDIHLLHSPQVGAVSAGHDVTVQDSHVLGSISAGHGVALLQSTVQGNISTGHEADLQGSLVDGSLFQGGHHLRLIASTVGQDVRFQGTQTSGQTVASYFAATGLQNGVSIVRVGEHSFSRLNGFTVQGAMNQTTVITPQQAIYVNGRKVSGDGPKTYTQYRQAFPMAPQVEGPGWQNNPAETGTVTSREMKPGNEPVVNILELTGNSQVNGRVVFESGYGKVLLHPGSHLVGQVVNGTVEKLPN